MEYTIRILALKQINGLPKIVCQHKNALTQINITSKDTPQRRYLAANKRWAAGGRRWVASGGWLTGGERWLTKTKTPKCINKKIPKLIWFSISEQQN